MTSFKATDIVIEYIKPEIKILGSVLRADGEGNWYEMELENVSSARIWGIKAQLRFYDKHSEFIGFEVDDHDSFVEPNRKIALAVFADAPAETAQVRLTIDATVEESDSATKDSWIAVGVLVLMVAGVIVYKLIT